MFGKVETAFAESSSGSLPWAKSEKPTDTSSTRATRQEARTSPVGGYENGFWQNVLSIACACELLELKHLPWANTRNSHEWKMARYLLMTDCYGELRDKVPKAVKRETRALRYRPRRSLED
jgi:hypothetical protein